jgi:antitoxin VapB
MTSPRPVKLFRNGRNQAVRIPRELELPGQDALIHRENGRLVIEAAKPRSLTAVLAELRPIEETFAKIDDPPARPVSL